MKNINLKTIRIDGNTQSRAELNESTVGEYAEVLHDGGELPAVVVFFDGSDNWLADGFHRFHAYGRDNRASIPSDVRQGTRRDALMHAAGANQTHGLRRTNDDKRRAVQILLDDADAAKWSDRKIAGHCGVTHPFVSGLRKPKVVTVTTPQQKKAEVKAVRDSTATPENSPKKVVTVTTPVKSVADEAHDDTDPIAEWERTQKELEKAEDVIKAMGVDDTKSELARQIRIRQGIEARLSDEMEKNKSLERTLAGYGKWYAELRKLTGIEDRSAITRFVRDAAQSKESAL